jgi:hypothetical protein
MLGVCVGLAHAGNWSQTTAAERDPPLLYATNGHQGATWASACLAIATGTAVPLDPVFPSDAKALYQTTDTPGQPTASAITAYPVPADAYTALTYPAAWKGRILLVTDVHGQEVLRMPLIAPGAQELDTRNLAAGVYSLQIVGVEGAGRLLVQH